MRKFHEYIMIRVMSLLRSVERKKSWKSLIRLILHEIVLMPDGRRKLFVDIICKIYVEIYVPIGLVPISLLIRKDFFFLLLVLKRICVLGKLDDPR